MPIEENALDNALTTRAHDQARMPSWSKTVSPSSEAAVDWSIAKGEQAPVGQGALESFGRGAAAYAKSSARGYLKTLNMVTGAAPVALARMEAEQRYAGHEAMPREMSGKIAHLLGPGFILTEQLRLSEILLTLLRKILIIWM